MLLAQQTASSRKKDYAKKPFAIVLCITFLAAGSLVYIVCRPESLMLFKWADMLGLGPIVHAIRATLSGVFSFLPGWFVYSAPFALWVASYVTIVKWIWAGHGGAVPLAWILAIPFIAFSAELGQLIGVVPGTFDYFDLVLIIAVSIIAIL